MMTTIEEEKANERINAILGELNSKPDDKKLKEELGSLFNKLLNSSGFTNTNNQKFFEG